MQDDNVIKTKVLLDKKYFEDALDAFRGGYDVLIDGILKINGRNKIFEYPKFKVIKPEEFFKI
jgi:hypothetical protein